MEEVVQADDARRVPGRGRELGHENDDVLVARIASGEQTSSRRRKTFFLTSKSSNTASTTRSTSARSPTRDVPLARARMAAADSAVKMLRATPSFSVRSIIDDPRATPVLDVVEHDVEAFRRHLLCDAAAHVAGADDGEALNGRSRLVGSWWWNMDRCRLRAREQGVKKDRSIVYDRAAQPRSIAPHRDAVPDRRTVLPLRRGDNAALGRLSGPQTKGDRIFLDIGVFDGDGEPVSDSLVEIWQADAVWRYVRPAGGDRRPAARRGIHGFGRLPNGNGWHHHFETIRPGRLPTRRAHCRRRTSTSVSLPAACSGSCTRVYFAGDPALEGDVIYEMVPADRRETARRRVPDQCRWRFAVRLQGEGETVFFDLCRLRGRVMSC